MTIIPETRVAMTTPDFQSKTAAILHSKVELSSANHLAVHSGYIELLRKKKDILVDPHCSQLTPLIDGSINASLDMSRELCGEMR